MDVNREDTKGSSRSGYTSEQLLADIQGGLANEFNTISQQYQLNLVASRSSAVKEHGGHVVISGQEHAPVNDPDPSSLANFLGHFQNLIKEKNLGALRIELNSSGLRNRPHFHMHIIRTADIDHLTSKSPEVDWKGEKFEYSSKLSKCSSTEFIQQTLTDLDKRYDAKEGFRTILTISEEGISIFVVKKADIPDSQAKQGEKVRSVDPWPLLSNS